MSAYTMRTVNWLLRELGIATKGPGRPRKVAPENELELLNALARGELYASICARLGISGNTIRRIRRKHETTNFVPRGTVVVSPKNQTQRI